MNQTNTIQTDTLQETVSQADIQQADIPQAEDLQKHAPELENYSICTFRIPEEGGRVLWEITNSCNYSCGYCVFSAANGKVPGELTTKETFEVLDGLKKRNFTHIKFTGGEPFIRKDFLDILKRSSELEFIVDVSTNASLITKEKAEQLSKLDLQMVHVSLDGYDQESHEAVRGPKTYSKTIRGIEHLVNNNLYVRLGTVIHKDNQDHLEEMVANAASLKVKEIIFSYMEPVGRMTGDYSQVAQKTVPELKAELETLAKKYSDQVTVNYSFKESAKACEEGTCPAVKKFLYLDNLGRVSPCTWVTEKNPEYRSTETVKTASFDKVMDSEPIKNYVEYVDNLAKSGCRECPAKIKYN